MTASAQRPLRLDASMFVEALVESLRKLDPRHMWGNPVMLVVEIGAFITTILTFTGEADTPRWFSGIVAVWLWLTVVFGNFAEAIAEGRGRAQAATLRAMRSETTARLRDGGTKNAGEVIPGDGTVVRGIASVDESAITGESAPVIREAGGDRSAVTGGTRVLSDE